MDLTTKVSPFSSKKTLNLGGKLYPVSQPLVMGILNVTPDSFYDGNRHNQPESFESRLQQMIEEGADIIDIGGYSTRPGAENVSVRQEISRVLPAIKYLKSTAPELPVSIDTFRSEVAQTAMDHGAGMINDVSGGNLDSEMFNLVAERKVPYVLSHMRGTPQTMTSLTDYDNLLGEIMYYFSEKISQLLDRGINDIIVDPGFGFAKTAEQNYQLLNNLAYFKELHLPIMVGLSRKSMIYRTLEISPDDALNGTTALNTIALMNGATILRVHDVWAARQAITLYLNTVNPDSAVSE